MAEDLDFQIESLAERFVAEPGAAEVTAREAHRRAFASPPGVWIYREPLESLLAQLGAAEERRRAGESLPLFGVPFAVKDNIDVAGIPTTAACPAFAYVPAVSAPAVARLFAAGAVCVGKTNLDQFATGLVGVRSPHGACPNPFDARYISGGSSSGSAVAVAMGQVSFALGTDTAGSGRVPAALTNIVGVKPTRGLVSTRGVVPACRSLDCVSVFAGSVADARAVLDVCAAFDREDPYSRAHPAAASGFVAPGKAPEPRPLRVGVLAPADLETFGDADSSRLYRESLVAVTELGATLVEIDFQPFRAVAELLYGGPWVAERLHAAGALLAARPEALLPVIREILEGARTKTALDAFQGQYRLEELRRLTLEQWKRMDAMLLPTTPTTYRLGEVDSEPIELNTRLGRYTNFANLLDLAAVAVPAGFRGNRLPLGVTFVAPAFSEPWLLALAERFHVRGASLVGATRTAVRPAAPRSLAPDGRLLLAVAGAHLSGQPLNRELTERNARLVRTCRTSGHYRLYALRTQPPKPGLVHDAAFQGTGIEVEVWSLDAASFGTFVDAVPAPLAIGTLTLDDGSSVTGFVCEPRALEGATDVTRYGGWRAYRSALA